MQGLADAAARLCSFGSHTYWAHHLEEQALLQNGHESPLYWELVELCLPFPCSEDLLLGWFCNLQHLAMWVTPKWAQTKNLWIDNGQALQL